MPSFKGWVHQQVAKMCGEYRPEIVNAAWEQIRYRAEHRGRHALIQAMGLEKSFQLNADVSHAVNMVVQTVVAGVFGEIPLTQEEKDAKFDAFKVMLAEMPKVETSWAQLESNAKTGALTMETLLDAVEKLKQYKAPAPQGPQVGEAVQEGDGWKVYDGAKWVHVAKEMAQYETLMAQAKFTGREDFLAKYSGLGGASYWKDEFQKAKPVEQSWGTKTSRYGVADSLAPLDFEKAKPFIRAVVERMLDLLGSEEHWIKNTEHRNVDGVDKYCLIGAQAKALADLTLTTVKSDPVVDEQRRRVIKAVEVFLHAALKEDKGFSSMPSFNDNAGTTFEDIRLWLKSLFDRLD